MSRLLLLALLLALASLPAVAQDVTVAITEAELTNDGAFNPDITCAAADDGSLIWFDFDEKAIYGYVGEGGVGTELLVSAADVEATAGEEVGTCRAAAYDAAAEVVYFALATASGVDFVVALDQGFALERLTDPAGPVDGITGMEVANGRLYIAVSEFFNDFDLEDGVYSLALSGTDQSPTEVLTEPDLSLAGLTADAAGDLYALSDRFGGGAYQNVIVAVEDPEGSPTLSVFDDPFDGSVFSDGVVADLTAIEAVDVSGSEALFVLNNSFDGPNGEEIARYTLDGTGELFTTETQILADLGRTEPEYTATGGPNGLIFDPTDARLLILNSDEFGGADEVLAVNDPAPTAAEPNAPEALAALTAWPSPTAARLSVALTLDRPQPVRVALYDALGREVVRLHDGPAAGSLVLTLDAAALGLPAGVYLVRAEAAGTTLSRTVTVVR